MIKKFMLGTFPKLLDVLVIVSFVGCFIMSIIVARTPRISLYSGVSTTFSFSYFLLLLCLGTVGIIVVYGVIYVLLDIRDSLKNK